MTSVRYTIRYRSGPQPDVALIVEDNLGDLYACTSQGPFARIPRPRLGPLLAQGWVAVETDESQPLDAILRTLAPMA